MSEIQWTDETINISLGCDLESPGCENCYAMPAAHRGLHESHRGLTVVRKSGVRWNGTVRLMPERLMVPFKWRKPKKIFVNSMSDLFHRKIPFEYIAACFGMMAACEHHTFQVLTKRLGRALEFFDWLEESRQHFDDSGTCDHADVCAGELYNLVGEPALPPGYNMIKRPWPLRNVWLGASVEDQQRADERIPLLLKCPAAVRFLSCEPLLERVSLAEWIVRSLDGPQLDWVIAGGESGPRARPCDVEWIRSIVTQCRGAAVPAFVKQLGARPFYADAGVKRPKETKGGAMFEWPEDLRVREWPRAS